LLTFGLVGAGTQGLGGLGVVLGTMHASADWFRSRVETSFFLGPPPLMVVYRMTLYSILFYSILFYSI